MIEIKNIKKAYGGCEVLKGISLSVARGDVYGLVGRSGAGKSTLLRCINGLEKFNDGTLLVNDVDISSLTRKDLRIFRKKMGMIFQNFSLLKRKTVYQNIALPMMCWRYSKQEIDDKVKKLIKIIDLGDKLHERPDNLSGGQKQRVAIARALSLDPEILLCDEITSALDPKTSRDILELLNKINEEFNITIVVVTHQMSVVKKVCHKICILEDGEIHADGEVGAIFLNEPPALKNLLGEEEILLPKGGVNLKIVYTDKNVNDRVISNMCQNLGIGFSLVWGQSEAYRNFVLGTAIINIDEDNLPAVERYIEELNLSWKVLEA
jgi:D-methionine transport system ATP-binding protein